MAENVKKKPEARPKKKTGLYVVLSGIAVLALGYILLSKGSITVAPVLIIGAFVVMAVGIMIGWD
jgi:hypothetical protein